MDVHQKGIIHISYGFFSLTASRCTMHNTARENKAWCNGKRRLSSSGVCGEDGELFDLEGPTTHRHLLCRPLREKPRLQRAVPLFGIHSLMKCLFGNEPCKVHKQHFTFSNLLTVALNCFSSILQMLSATSLSFQNSLAKLNSFASTGELQESLFFFSLNWEN